MIDTKQLCLHSSAFGIYLVAQLMYFSTWTIRTNRKNESNLLFIAQLGTSCYILFNCVSQVLLCVIFWDLGKQDNIELDLDDLAEEDILNTLEVQDFDEDADLQARIWNRFQREDRSGSMARSTMRLSRKSDKKASTLSLNRKSTAKHISTGVNSSIN